MYNDEKNPYYDELIKNVWWFSEINRLVKEYNIYDLFINNFGVAYRDNKQMLVILDSGISDEVDD
jgi:hypothetical protein